MLRGSSGPGSLFRELVLNGVKNSKTQIQNDCLTRLYEADSELKAISTELDSFDGKKDPVRCNLLVNQLRTAQDKVISLLFQLMDDCNCERASRDYRMKFPDEILLSEGSESLNGQIWFGAECLAAGSNILNHNKESTMLRPMAKTLTQHLDSLRNDLRDLVLDGGGAARLNHTLIKKMIAFDHIFATFEYEYVRTMLPIRTVAEIEKLQEVAVLFSETLIDCVKRGLIKQDDIDEFQPIVMIAIPRLAIVRGLLYKNENPIYTRHKSQMCSLFQPFHGPLHSIRKLLRGLSPQELLTLEKMLANDQSSSNENSQESARQSTVPEVDKLDSEGTSQTRVITVEDETTAVSDESNQAGTSNSNYTNVLMDGLQYPVGQKRASMDDSQSQSAKRQDDDCYLEMQASSSKTKIDDVAARGARGVSPTQDDDLSPSPSTSLSSPQRQASESRSKSVPCKCASSSRQRSSQNDDDDTYDDEQSRNQTCDTENCCLSPPGSDAQLEKLIANFSPSMNDEPESSTTELSERQQHQQAVAATVSGLSSSGSQSHIAASESAVAANKSSSSSPPSSSSSSRQLAKGKNVRDEDQSEIQEIFQKQALQLLHRLFVAISGVADQLQSNFASDLRFILRHIFSSELAGDDEEGEQEDDEQDEERHHGRPNEIYEEEEEGEYSNEHSDSSLPIEEGIEAQETNLIDFESGYTLMDTLNWENYYSDPASSNGAHPFIDPNAPAGQPQATRRHLPPRPQQTQHQQQAIVSQDTNDPVGQCHASRHCQTSAEEGSARSNPTNTFDHHQIDRELIADLIRSTTSQGLIYDQESPSDRSIMDENHQRLVQQHLQSVSRATSRIAAAAAAASAANLAGTYGHSMDSGSGSGNHHGHHHHQQYQVSSGQRGSGSSSERRHRHHGSSRSRRARGPPVWVADQDVVQCGGCSAPFTLFRRRHHCRACGQIFCNECSKFTKNLNCWGYNGPVRVCEACYLQP